MESPHQHPVHESLNRAPWQYQALATIGRLYPFYSGPARVAHSSLFKGLAKPEERITWCRGPGGLMLVPLNDFVGRCVYFVGDYDPKISWLCRRIVSTGDTVLDVGANIGVVTLLLARCVGETGIVHAFEPNPHVSGLLTRSAALNRFSNVRIHNFALGSDAGMFELNVPRDNAGQGSLVYHKTMSDRDSIKVSVRRLSDVIEEQGITKIRFIKIDVEGFEAEVLRGATKMLKTVRPDLILLESPDTLENVPFHRRPVIQILQKANYRLFALPKSMISMRVVPIDAERHDQAPSHDVLAVHSDAYLDISARLSVPRE